MPFTREVCEDRFSDRDSDSVRIHAGNRKEILLKELYEGTASERETIQEPP